MNEESDAQRTITDYLLRLAAASDRIGYVMILSGDVNGVSSTRTYFKTPFNALTILGAVDHAGAVLKESLLTQSEEAKDSGELDS